MPSGRSKLGAEGERIAAAHLRARGLSIEAWNYRTRFGEIDLVARDGGDVVFVEVKTRRTAAYGAPEESVTPRKQARLAKAAMQYLEEHRLEQSAWRVDVVAITLQRNGPADITHLESVVEEAYASPSVGEGG